MNSYRRPNLPGAAFHVTSRIQAHEPLLEPLRTAATEIFFARFEETDARLLAYAIMPNHFHLVLQQGTDSLGRLLQSPLRRIAGLVQRRAGLEGHVFERRFRSFPCLTPAYLRNAIVYTHLNPLRAQLCEDPADYRWSSQALYRHTGGRAAPSRGGGIAVFDGLRLFASEPTRTLNELSSDYDRFVQWRQRCDEMRREGESEGEEPAPPPALAGDEWWAERFQPSAYPPPTAPTRWDLIPAGSGVRPEAVAEEAIRAASGRLSLSEIRGPTCHCEAVRLRRKVARRLIRAGLGTVETAEFLGVSHSAVSRYRTASTP
jgi:REP element-mobilizing transposase RayT